MFLIFSYNIKDGKEVELKEWLKKTGEPYLKSVAEFKSVRTYVRRFGLGHRPQFETWLEVPNFASLVFLDKWQDDPIRMRVFRELLSLSTDFNSSIVREI